ncbi:MAG: PAS domain-containing protein [Alphaproteobacteria bacterium]|nr:PAS domain-containing protein [Alphaproteobacteria bacterium]MBV9371900.1 PAS domain-containing protein [Alphaproteobacteria bacterium]MBV9902286.1 PAS domain-containing protein [Alphaproteobacteria bacterium]
MASTILKRDSSENSGMGARIRAFDWASTPLGPMEDWPPTLKLALNICEHSRFPTAIYWGPELRLIYNDAWSFIPGERHPAALGQPARQVWSDIWPVIGPQFEQVMATGEGVSTFDQMLPMVRNGIEQETYWNYSLTPLVDDTGRVVGIFNQGNEVTRAVVTERRLAFQVKLADRIRGLVRPDEVKAAAAAMLGEYLGAARAGFAEIDEANDTVSVTGEWRRDDEVQPLQGRTGRFSELPQAAIDYLRSGEVLALADVDNFSRGSSQADASLGATLGARAVITVPLVRDGAFAALFYVHETEPREWRRSEAAMARDAAERSWAAVQRAESEQRLRASEDHYRHAVELNPQVSWTATPDGQLNRVARRWHDWTGTTGLGDSWTQGLHPDDRERTAAVWRRSVLTGEPYDIEHRVKLVDGSYRWARSRAFPRYDGAGNIRLWYGATEDVHERKAAEVHQRLLINELNHRVKNTLATVQAIAFQTLKGDIPLAEARARFEARLMALSRAHNLLTEQNWGGAALRRLVVDATEHLVGERARLDVEGEDVWLSPRAALALALAFHELATNAAKHGALSLEGGGIAVAWRTDGDRLRLEWKESGGPAVAPPQRRGFGSRLIERGLAADLGGGAALHFEPDGLLCRIEASLAAVRGEDPAHA